MELNDRVSQLEDEIKILKNEIQAVLLDLRESYTDLENPFNLAAMAVAAQPIIINNQAPPAATPQAPPPPEPNPAPSAPVAPPEPVALAEPLDQILAADEILAPDPPAAVEPSLSSKPEELPYFETESFGEAEAEYEYHAVATAETAQGEVNRVWRPALETEADASADEKENSPGTIDLTTIAGLANWIGDVTRRFGSERAESMLDMSELMGFIDAELRSILSKFIFPSAGEYAGKMTTHNYMATLKGLDDILGKATKLEIAVLSILCQGADSG